MTGTDLFRSEAPEFSVGELKALQREQQLCGQCRHAVVCKIAAAIEPGLLIIINQCLAFEPTMPEQNDPQA